MAKLNMALTFIANWKMQLSFEEAGILAKKIKKILPKNDDLVIVCPAFVNLSDVKEILKKSKIRLGAQDCFWEQKGSYTGEISPRALKEIGCDYVIVGHSERRQYLKEDDLMIHNKIKAALQADLIPILCVGETFDERRQGIRDYVLIAQIQKALQGIEINNKQSIIIAYEPVWVIGSGQAVSVDDATNACEVIRHAIFDIFDEETAVKVKTIYGGSVDSNNASSFLASERITGLLVGGASLSAVEFKNIIDCKKI